jgi:DNA-binding NarL/FixJ family response regulator
VRVVIVEDEGLLLDMLTTSLPERGVEVVGQARDIPEALQVVDQVAPDVALLDIRLLPNRSDEGIQLAEQLRERYPEVGLLVLSAHAETAYAERLLNMQESSRSLGYLLKERVGDLGELVAGIERVARGELVIDSLIIDRVMSRPRTTDPLAKLTPHERRILTLVAEGRSNLGIARHLGCRITTVEKHLSAITTKLDLVGTLDRDAVNVRVLQTLAFLRNR